MHIHRWQLLPAGTCAINLWQLSFDLHGTPMI